MSQRSAKSMSLLHIETRTPNRLFAFAICFRPVLLAL